MWAWGRGGVRACRACDHAGRATMQGVLLPVRERERERVRCMCMQLSLSLSLSPSLVRERERERERKRVRESEKEGKREFFKEMTVLLVI